MCWDEALVLEIEDFIIWSVITDNNESIILLKCKWIVSHRLKPTITLGFIACIYWSLFIGVAAPVRWRDAIYATHKLKKKTKKFNLQLQFSYLYFTIFLSTTYGEIKKNNVLLFVSKLLIFFLICGLVTISWHSSCSLSKEACWSACNIFLLLILNIVHKIDGGLVTMEVPK